MKMVVVAMHDHDTSVDAALGVLGDGEDVQ